MQGDKAKGGTSETLWCE